MVIRQIEVQVTSLRAQQKKVVEGMQDWIAVYHENTVFPEPLKLENLVKIDRVVKAKGNIAGVTIPVFKELAFFPIEYDLYEYPLWVDKALESLRDCARFDALISTLEQQIHLLGKELRTTSQRVNLFEKVKIPESRENIRRIGIYLGDQQTAAVVRGKIAKKKLVKGM
jgi:V/A-type H+-transporting ATPase subunit D